MTESQPQAVPQSSNLEMCVLGGIMIDPVHALPIAQRILIADDFWLEGHKLIYRIMLESSEEGIPPDFTIVNDILRKRDLQQKVGGSGVLFGMTNSIPTAENVESHAMQLRDIGLSRRIIKACVITSKAAYTQEQTPEQMICNLQKKLKVMEESTSVSEGAVKVLPELASQAFDRVYQEAEEREQGIIRTIPTFIPELDNLASPLKMGQFVIVGARQGVGKSTVSMNMLVRLALQGFKVGYISLEMSQDSLEEYLLPMYLNMAGRKVMRRDVFGLKKSDIPGTLKGYYDIIKEETNFFVVWTYRASLRRIRDYLRKLKKLGVQVVVVDQAEHINEYIPDDRASLHAMIREISALAKEFDIVLIVNHQISRAGEERPKVKDLKDSSFWEDMADSILLLHDPLLFLFRQHAALVWDAEGNKFRAPKASDVESDMQTTIPNPRQLEVILGKTRSGNLGLIKVWYDMRIGCMVNTDGIAM